MWYRRTLPDLPGISNNRKDKLAYVVSQIFSQGILCCWLLQSDLKVLGLVTQSNTRFTYIFNFTRSLSVAGNLLSQAVFLISTRCGLLHLTWRLLIASTSDFQPSVSKPKPSLTSKVSLLASLLLDISCNVCCKTTGLLVASLPGSKRSSNNRIKVKNIACFLHLFRSKIYKSVHTKNVVARPIFGAPKLNVKTPAVT